MPLYQSWETDTAAIAIWEITEAEDFFVSQLGFGSDKKHLSRRLEHLAGRFLLKYLKPDFPFDEMVISELGKPQHPYKHIFFSISHSYPYAAAIISKQQEVGIDIQIYQEKIIRIQHKFLTEAEQSICRGTLENITLAWTAKEALFKYYGLGAVDFKADMPITKITSEGNRYHIEMILEKTREACVLQGILEPNFALSYL